MLHTPADLRDLLQRPFELSALKSLLRERIFPGLEFHRAPRELLIDEGGLHRVIDLGRLVLPTRDGRSLQVAVFEVPFDAKSHVQVMRNRVGLRALVRRFLTPGDVDAGIGLFHHPKQSTWRLSYIERSTAFDANHQLREEETAPKRYSFLLGPDESSLTAAQRLGKLAALHEGVTREDVLEAFSVERLSDEFFKSYKDDHYTAFVRALQALPDKARQRAFPAETTAAHEKLLRDFAKKLLGRLVFLHFLQKKGWLGVPAGEPWGRGDRNFFRQFFRSFPRPERFHSEALSALFFETLNTRRKGDLFALTKTRIPYLNGGLFDPDPAAMQKLDLPPKLFSDLFNFFEAYNFTIDENAPDDHDVGIDPEMLGRIFENLLEDNKDKGAYYTPKEIVHYMCQESLLRYLRGHLLGAAVPDDDTRVSALGRFVRAHDKGEADDKSNFIKASATRIAQLLDEVRVCDPAIGSGAFPMGILQEILAAQTTLDWTLDRAAAKRAIIQRCIYGVDIDAGAVDIARLRFWLSLVVDEHEPSPLPNLDYKIMQGNSLLESFDGIRLDQLAGPRRKAAIRAEQCDLGLAVEGETGSLTLESDATTSRQLSSRLVEYFSLEDQATKRQLHSEIDATVLGHIRHNLALHRMAIESRRDRLEIDHEEKAAAATTKAQRSGFIENWPGSRDGREHAKLTAELERVTASEEKLAELYRKPERPFFLWHLFFQDVFTRGGFDIVIANPPYVRQEAIKDQKPALEAEGYECYDGVADLLVYFYERAVKLLRPGGVLTFITSNKFYRAGYGTALRAFLTRNLTLHRLIDFGDAPVFDAIAYASILEAAKTTPAANVDVIAYTWERTQPLTHLGTTIASRGRTIQQSALTKEGWRLESSAALALLAKLKGAGKPLGEYVGGRIYRGILTGLNEAFVVDRETRDQLVASHKSSERLLKPFLRGRDVKRWLPEYADQFLIKIESSANATHPWSGRGEREAENIFAKTYPAVHVWLDQFRADLKKREDQGRYFWELRSCAYWREFSQTKLIVPAISGTVNVAVDADGYFSNNKSSIFVCDDAFYVAAVVNTKIALWFARQVFATKQGGFLDFEPRYSSQWPVPAATPSQQREIASLVERIVSVKSRAGDADVATLEAEIESRVADLFHLSDAEMALINSSLDAPAHATTTPSIEKSPDWKDRPFALPPTPRHSALSEARYARHWFHATLQLERAGVNAGQLIDAFRSLFTAESRRAVAKTGGKAGREWAKHYNQSPSLASLLPALLGLTTSGELKVTRRDQEIWLVAGGTWRESPSDWVKADAEIALRAVFDAEWSVAPAAAPERLLIDDCLKQLARSVA